MPGRPSDIDLNRSIATREAAIPLPVESTADHARPHSRRVWKRALGVSLALASFSPAALADTASALVRPLPTDFTVAPGGTCEIRTRPTWASAAEQFEVMRQHNSMYASINTFMGASTFYNEGYFGQGVDIAVIDTGVAPVPGLTGDNVLPGPDLSFESQAGYAAAGKANADLVGKDGFGHGTHMAGIIAGSDAPLMNRANLVAGRPAAYPYWNLPFFSGVAPLGRVVPIKVADSSGTADITQVIQAIDWAVAHRNDNGLRIRVLNLSYGVYSFDDKRENLLSHAIQAAWDNGIVVVVAAGNDGRAINQYSPGVTAPAYNMDVITVGAYGPEGVAGFTSGASTSNRRMPDLAAPGVSIPSLRAPGATSDEMVLDHCRTTVAGDPANGVPPATWRQPIVGPNGRFIRGSGSSQAAAMVSGAVALMLSENPNYTPDEIKDLLRKKATALPGNRMLTGEGLVNLSKLFSAKPARKAEQGHAKVTGDGTLDNARGWDIETGRRNILIDPTVLEWTFEWKAGACKDAATIPADQSMPWCHRRFAELSGNEDVTGAPIDLNRLRNAQRAGKAWRTVTNPDGTTMDVWEGSGQAFTGGRFVFDPVHGKRWEGRTWRNTSWSGRTWRDHDWTGRTWRNGAWTGRTWRDGSWTGRTWRDAFWSHADWS
jgi:serine protease AprX